MNQQAINERLKAAPNPVIDNYRKIVNQNKKQIIDNNHVGWRVLEMIVDKKPRQFFDQHGHWLSWKDAKLQSNARSAAEKSVSIGITLTKYWQGKSLNMIQMAMIKPYLKFSKKQFLR